MSKENMHRMLHERLQYRKTCEKWVPKYLTEAEDPSHVCFHATSYAVPRNGEPIPFKNHCR